MNVNESFPLRHWRPSPWNLEFVSYQHKITENWHILSLTIKKVKTKTLQYSATYFIPHSKPKYPCTKCKNRQWSENSTNSFLTWWLNGWWGSRSSCGLMVGLPPPPPSPNTIWALFSSRKPLVLARFWRCCLNATKPVWFNKCNRL